MNFVQQLWAAIQPVVIVLVFALVAACAKAWSDALIYAAQMIYQAAIDESLQTGKEKMQWVVQHVRAYLPIPMRSILSDTAVRKTCQTLYDTIKLFAENYFYKAAVSAGIDLAGLSLKGGASDEKSE